MWEFRKKRLRRRNIEGLEGDHHLATTLVFPGHTTR